MAFTITWDDSFEAIPSDSNYGYDLDTFIQDIKIGIRERAEIEHIWKIGATDGQHVPGLVRVVKVDTDANVLSFSGKKDAIAFATDTKKFYRNTADGANWSVIDIDHGSFSGLTDDDHTIYLLVDGTRALSGNLSAGSNKITSLATPTADGDAASKGYVDGEITGIAPLTDGSFTAATLTPTNASWNDLRTLDIVIGATSDEILLWGFTYFSTSVAGVVVEVRIYDSTDSLELAYGKISGANAGDIVNLCTYKTGLSVGTHTIKLQIKPDTGVTTCTDRCLSSLWMA